MTQKDRWMRFASRSLGGRGLGSELVYSPHFLVSEAGNESGEMGIFRKRKWSGPRFTVSQNGYNAELHVACRSCEALGLSGCLVYLEEAIEEVTDCWEEKMHTWVAKVLEKFVHMKIGQTTTKEFQKRVQHYAEVYEALQPCLRALKAVLGRDPNIPPLPAPRC